MRIVELKAADKIACGSDMCSRLENKFFMGNNLTFVLIQMTTTVALTAGRVGTQITLWF